MDSTFNLTEREKRMLEKSWAKTFADKVFPSVDENIFSVLYSEKSSRPNTPVNVIVWALILKEALNVTDDEIVELKLLIDAVESSKFITKKKSESNIRAYFIY